MKKKNNALFDAINKQIPRWNSNEFFDRDRWSHVLFVQSQSPRFEFKAFVIQFKYVNGLTDQLAGFPPQCDVRYCVLEESG